MMTVVFVAPTGKRHADTHKDNNCRHPDDFDPPGFHVASLAVFGYRV
jgi:hypothetical protein